MDLKKEFQEYRKIYNVFFDSLEKELKLAREKEKEIIVKDKEDIEMQNESKEKQEMLQNYIVLLYKINLIQNDLQKIGERVLYINEASIRNSVNLELNDVDTKFVQNLALNSSQTYAIQNDELVPKIKELESVIAKKVKDNVAMPAMYIQQIRNSKAYTEQ